MFGKSGPMPISEFQDLIHRNAYKPNIRWISSRWGARNGAPDGTCTMLVGAWLPVRNTNERVFQTVHRDHVGAYNVPTPVVPEFTDVDPESQEILARGWRGLLPWLIADRVIRPSPEIETWLGHREFDSAVRGLGCF